MSTFRKELSEEELTEVAGGNYNYDRTAGIICIGVKGNYRKFKVNDGEIPDDISKLLQGCYKETNTNDENDSAMILALQGHAVEVF